MNRAVSKIKDYFASISRLVAALFLSGTGILIAVQIYSSISDYFEKKSLEKYSIVKTWPYDLRQIGLKAVVRSKVVDRELLVTVDLEGYPAFLNDPALEWINKNEQRGFFIIFKDSDGFNVEKIDVPLKSLSTRVTDSGKPTGLSGQFETSLSADEYKRIAKIAIEWTLDTDIPKPVPPASAPRPRPSLNTSDGANGDHCEPAISRDLRLKRLAQHGSVRQQSENRYVAGAHTLSLFDDGTVLYCD